MSFLYPRLVSFHRPAGQTGVGAVAYGGQVEANETKLACDVRCSIQERREGTNNPVGLPGDGTKPTWYVFIPKSSMAIGSIKYRDVMIDEFGSRYQVVSPYFDSLGARLTVISLEA